MSTSTTGTSPRADQPVPDRRAVMGVLTSAKMRVSPIWHVWEFTYEPRIVEQLMVIGPEFGNRLVWNSCNGLYQVRHNCIAPGYVNPSGSEVRRFGWTMATQNSSSEARSQAGLLAWQSEAGWAGRTIVGHRR
jgi:hypothetical protein